MRKIIVWTVVCLMIAFGLVACSGGGSSSSSDGGAADTMTVTITDLSTAVTTTYTEGGYNTYHYLDPNLSSNVAGTDTWVVLSTGATGTSHDMTINIVVRGNTPGSYPTGTTSSSSYISYTTYASGIQPYNSTKSSSTGTIILSNVGNVGETFTGTFDAVVTHISFPTNTRGISGTFSVKRDH